MTYPLQFAAGALINTAGSGNDFVGGTNGYGNVEFNGLPALSNGYIVDGLETNDPLTNLNSGLSTNLVLGLNSISEVTVNTLSYSVDQGRYGASQVNYVTKSGTNQFHGNLYEMWNGSLLNAADYFTNATPGQSQAAIDRESFWRQPGRPDRSRQAVLLLRQRMGADCLAHRHADDRSHPGVPDNMSCSNFRWVATDSVTGSNYPAAPQLVPFYQKMFSLYGNTSGTPLAVLGCPFNADGSSPPGSSAERERLRQPAKRFALQRRPRAGADRLASITTSTENDTAWFRFQSDTGVQAAYTDPINPLFNAISPQPLYSFAAGYTHVFSQNLVNYFNPAFSWYESLFGPSDFQKTLAAFPDCVAGQRRERALHDHRRARQHLGAGKARLAVLHQRQSGLEPRRARTAVRHQYPNLPPE